VYTLVPYLVIGWLGVALLLFSRYSKPVAVIAICLLGTLFLPEVQWSPIAPNTVKPIRVPGLDFTKINVMSYGLLLGWLFIDGGRLRGVRWSFWDVPAVVLGVFPAVSCLMAGQSPQNAFSEFRHSLLQYTVPYIVGRVYLSDGLGCRRVTLALIFGGLVYIPLCLYEIRMSPQLNNIVFGFQQHSFLQTARFGGYRPMVFMQHGLAVSLLMVSATLSLFWLWRAGVWPTDEVPTLLAKWPGPTFLALLGTAALCRSFGAIALGCAGFFVFLIGDRLRLRLPLILLMAVMPAYAAGRATGWLKADDLIALLGSRVNQERTESFEYRLVNEDKFIAAMGPNVLFGMGNDPDKRPKDHNSVPLIVDGLWIVEYFANGVVGLTALCAFFLLPVLRFLWNHPPTAWATPAVAPAAIAATLCVIWLIDCVPNAMLNPLYFLMVAALNGWNDGIGAMRRHLAAVPTSERG
jgi:hypothetical protein